MSSIGEVSTSLRQRLATSTPVDSATATISSRPSTDHMGLQESSSLSATNSMWFSCNAAAARNSSRHRSPGEHSSSPVAA